MKKVEGQEEITEKNDAQEIERAETENRENVGTVRIWSMAAAVSFISCGKIANGMLKSRSKDKNAA